MLAAVRKGRAQDEHRERMSLRDGQRCVSGCDRFRLSPGQVVSLLQPPVGEERRGVQLDAYESMRDRFVVSFSAGQDERVSRPVVSR